MSFPTTAYLSLEVIVKKTAEPVLGIILWMQKAKKKNEVYLEPNNLTSLTYFFLPCPLHTNTTTTITLSWQEHLERYMHRENKYNQTNAHCSLRIWPPLFTQDYTPFLVRSRFQNPALNKLESLHFTLSTKPRPAFEIVQLHLKKCLCTPYS